MIKNDSDDLKQKDLDEFNNKCEECKKEEETSRERKRIFNVKTFGFVCFIPG